GAAPGALRDQSSQRLSGPAQSLEGHHMPAPQDTAAMITTLVAQFDGLVRPNEPLARHGTFGVGGSADAWVSIEREDDMVRLVSQAQAHGWPVMLVGNGTNVLYADSGARGIVARMALGDWRLEAVDDAHTRLIVGAGASLPKLINDLAER